MADGAAHSSSHGTSPSRVRPHAQSKYATNGESPPYTRQRVWCVALDSPLVQTSCTQRPRTRLPVKAQTHTTGYSTTMAAACTRWQPARRCSPHGAHLALPKFSVLIWRPDRTNSTTGVYFHRFTEWCSRRPECFAPGPRRSIPDVTVRHTTRDEPKA